MMSESQPPAAVRRPEVGLDEMLDRAVRAKQLATDARSPASIGQWQHGPDPYAMSQMSQMSHLNHGAYGSPSFISPPGGHHDVRYQDTPMYARPPAPAYGHMQSAQYQVHMGPRMPFAPSQLPQQHSLSPLPSQLPSQLQYVADTQQQQQQEQIDPEVQPMGQQRGNKAAAASVSAPAGKRRKTAAAARKASTTATNAAQAIEVIKATQKAKKSTRDRNCVVAACTGSLGISIPGCCCFCCH